MRTRDYRDVVGEGPQFADDQRAYILQLGSVELEPIAYSTLLGLGDRPVVVCEILERCFVDRPVMWAEPGTVEAESAGARLGEIEARLQAQDLRLEASAVPSDRVLARVVGLWLGLTREAVARLARGRDADGESAPQSVLLAYRRSVYACVEALLQLLPERDDCARATRAQLELGRENLASVLGVEPERLEHAGWLADPLAADDRGFVTWGIP